MLIHDIYENLRRTTSDLKINKNAKREYKFNDGEKPPKTRKEYKEIKEQDER